MAKLFNICRIETKRNSARRQKTSLLKFITGYRARDLQFRIADTFTKSLTKLNNQEQKAINAISDGTMMKVFGV